MAAIVTPWVVAAECSDKMVTATEHSDIMTSDIILAAKQHMKVVTHQFTFTGKTSPLLQLLTEDGYLSKFPNHRKHYYVGNIAACQKNALDPNETSLPLRLQA